MMGDMMIATLNHKEAYKLRPGHKIHHQNWLLECHNHGKRADVSSFVMEWGPKDWSYRRKTVNTICVAWHVNDQ